MGEINQLDQSWKSNCKWNWTTWYKSWAGDMWWHGERIGTSADEPSWDDHPEMSCFLVIHGRKPQDSHTKPRQQQLFFGLNVEIIWIYQLLVASGQLFLMYLYIYCMLKFNVYMHVLLFTTIWGEDFNHLMWSLHFFEVFDLNQCSLTHCPQSQPPIIKTWLFLIIHFFQTIFASVLPGSAMFLKNRAAWNSFSRKSR